MIQGSQLGFVLVSYEQKVLSNVFAEMCSELELEFHIKLRVPRRTRFTT